MECRYEKEWTDEVGEIWVCQRHNNNSKHDVDKNPHAPCLTVDPYEDINVFTHFDSTPSVVETPKPNPIEALGAYGDEYIAEFKYGDQLRVHVDERPIETYHLPEDDD